MESTTTEFWSSENEFDVAQLITKRILYAFHLWTFRLGAFQLVFIFLSIVFGIPLLVSLVGLLGKINEKTQRKRRYLVKLRELAKERKRQRLRMNDSLLI